MSVTVPSLPFTFRPYVARRVILGLAVLVTIVLGLVAATLPSRDTTPGGFSTFDRVGFVVILALVLAGLFLLNRPRIRADSTGLVVTNVFRARRLEWAEVVDVSLSRDDPWLVLDLADGTTLAAMGVQTSDGQRAQVAAAQLSALVATHSAPPYDG